MPKTLSKAEIAPLTVLPYRKSVFSYATQTKLSIGDLVSISFGKRTLSGIVLSSAKLPGRKPQWLKEVSSVLEPEWLTKEQLELASYISTTYFTPLGKVLKHFSPARVKARTTKKDTPSLNEALRATAKENSLSRKLFASKKDTAVLKSILDTSGIHTFQILCKKILERDQQILILAPEIASVVALEHAFEKVFPKKSLVTLHSALAQGVYAAHWKRIRDEKRLIIIATRQGMFAPFQNLGLVIHTESNSESYKQWDQSPRYETGIVVRKLKDLYRCRLLATGALPDDRSYRDIQEGRSVDLSTPSALPPLSYVNLRLERYKKNFSPFSETLRESIRATLSAKQQVLISVTQSGESHFSVCTECKNILRCPTCERALKQKDDGRFFCPICKFETESFPHCPTCEGLQFRSFGFGTGKVTREVKKLFPHALVFEATKKKLSTLKQIESFLKKAASGQVDIIVGTQLALKSLPLSNLALIGIIDADSLAERGGFQADTEYLTLIARAAQQVEKIRGNIVVQTFHPEKRLFLATLQTPLEQLFADHLEERKVLRYPPYTRAISLTKSASVKSFSLERFFQNLTKDYASALEHRHLFIDFLETDYRKGAPSRIIIRYTDSLPSSLQALLEKNLESLIIDHDPLRLV